MSQPEAVTTATLPDGSSVTCEMLRHNATMITRTESGVVVWGQSFSTGGTGEDHGEQVAEVVAKMVASPADFYQWWNK